MLKLSHYDEVPIGDYLWFRFNRKEGEKKKEGEKRAQKKETSIRKKKKEGAFKRKKKEGERGRE